MNTTTISINSKDLPYTIDTYGMFNGESTDESESDYLLETYPKLQAWLDKGNYIGFDYDHKRIVEALAGSSLAIIEQALHFETPKVVIGCPIIKTSNSPQFYNYTTDSYTADWTVDVEALNSVLDDDWRYKALESGWTDDDIDGENEIVAKLEQYLLSILDTEDYEMSMFEAESEAYYENMTPDTDTQAEIDKLTDESEA